LIPFLEITSFATTLRIAYGVGGASAYTLTGPSSVSVGQASTFTVDPNGPLSGSVTITPSGAGLSTPIVLTWSGTEEAKTFQITPTTVGNITLTPTNSAGMTNPANLVASSQLSESFESVSIGAFPAAWSRYADSGGPIVVADGSALSPPTASVPNCLSSAAGRFCRAWPNTFTATSVSVSASVINYSSADATLGTGLFARSSNPGSASFSGYALLMSRNGRVMLYRFDSGTGTQIGLVASIPYIPSGTRHLMSLECLGTAIKAKVYAQTGTQAGQYIQTDGSWSAPNVYCLNVVDATYADGYAGVIKNSPYTSFTDYWDDVLIQSADGDAIVPSVTLTAPANAANVTGLMTASATASDNVGIQRVDFTVDGVVKASILSAPYTAQLQSAAWSNGSHTVAAVAYDSAGNSASSSVTVTSSNDTALTRPTINLAQSHLRNSQLCYSSTAAFNAADNAVAPYVDVCVADTSKAATLRALRSDMHLLLYSNAHFINLNQLGDWISYARVNGHSPEAGFWHAAQAYTFTGSGTGWHPPKKFWAMFSGTTNPWTDKRGAYTSATSVAFPNTSGESLYIGNMDPFRELNVGSITVPKAGGWTYALEYCSAVDGSGNPTTWTTLSTLSDTTTGFASSGQILFDPPANWVPCGINGQISFAGDTGTTVARLRYFYIRVRVTASGTGPTTAELSGRDYAASGYTQSGTTPAFDYAADLDSDGYLTDAEYATRATGKNARFAYEGRIPSQYGVQRMLMRYSQQAPVDWLAAHDAELMTANPTYNGIFMDNSIGVIKISQSYIIEPIASSPTEYGLALNAAWKAMPAHATMGQRWIMPNVAGSTDQAIADMVVFVPSYFMEFGYRAVGTSGSLGTSWTSFDGMVNQVASWQSVASPEPLGFIDTDVFPDLSANMSNPIYLMAALCYHYMIKSAGTYHMYWGGRNPSESWRNKWFLAAQYNVGQPTGALSVMATGTDPDTSVAANLTYKVYSRQYGNALILLKPLSYTSPNTGAYTPASGTTHSLTALNAAGYKPVSADGTLGSTITSITLENGQGAILIPQ
jgi:hypothetical protein